MARSPTKKLSGWWLDKVRDNATPHLEQGESIQAAAYGQQTKYQFSSFFCFWKACLFAVTERHLYVFRGGALNSAKVVAVLTKRPLDQAVLVHDGRALKTDDIAIWPPPGAGPETTQLLECFANRAAPATTPIEAPGASATPATPVPPQSGSVPPPAASVPPPVE